jgi:hypothetical protein
MMKFKIEPFTDWRIVVEKEGGKYLVILQTRAEGRTCGGWHIVTQSLPIDSYGEAMIRAGRALCTAGEKVQGKKKTQEVPL